MLKHQLLHPQISAVLARAGHTAKVLIADGNYPASSTLGPRAELVSLNLSPGVVTCTQVLEALATAIPIEAAHTMQPDASGPHALPHDPPIWAEFRTIFRQHAIAIELQPIERSEFYRTVQSPEHVLTIQTADQRQFANLLLVVGVRKD
ncbi:MAG TPA: RbsD/FucU family protein [Pirellulales bacterium]|jgi:L-fucose mutarotase|nr:RbsD/FucU family protein [Pirellulales bacterium]